MNEAIPLSQKLYLLGINPNKGGIIQSAYSTMDYILLGSLFLELHAKGNIRFESKKIIVLKSKTDIPIHGLLLDKLSQTEKSLNISRWINKLHFALKKIRKLVQKDLVAKRLIRLEAKNFLFIRWNKPVLVKKHAVIQLILGIEKQIIGGVVEKDDIILLSMLKPAKLLHRIFPERQKRKRAKAKLNRLLVENQVSIPVTDAISAVHAVAASVAVNSAATGTN